VLDTSMHLMPSEPRPDVPSTAGVHPRDVGESSRVDERRDLIPARVAVLPLNLALDRL
jgi:hypothetical protein